MALSIYSNWATPAGMTPLPEFQSDHDDMALLPEFQSEVADALLGFLEPIEASDLLIDSFLNPPVDDSITGSNPPFTDPSLMPIVPPPSEDLDFEIYRCCSKYPRSSEDLFHPSHPMLMNSNSALDELASSHSVTSCPMQADPFATEFVIPQLPPVMDCSLRFNAGVEEKKESSGSLSAQSAAARERRKRISEKTHELGRQIPGGKRMSTAEMFHAAYKYVKFLQAQIGILELVGSDKMEREVGEQMEVLLASPTIQEKLCGEGKCLVAKDMVDTLAQDKEIRSNTVVSRELDRFIQSMG